MYTASGGIVLAVIERGQAMGYLPPFERNDSIDSLYMEIAKLVGMLSPDAPLAKSPLLHRELRIKTIHSSLPIEGNKLAEKAVTAILDGKRVLGDADDILELENAKRAYTTSSPNSTHAPLKISCARTAS